MPASENDVPTEKAPVVPKAIAEDWGVKTTFGVIAGMLYGGTKEAMTFSDKEETLLAHQQTAELNPLRRRNLLRAIMEEKVLRVARGTVMGGAKLGIFTGLYCATEQYMELRRSTRDYLNVAAAGSLTAAAVGLMLPGSITWRLRSALLGSVIGGALGIPLGLLQSTVEKLVTSDELNPNDRQQDGPLDNDAVADTIRRLEDRVSSQK